MFLSPTPDWFEDDIWERELIAAWEGSSDGAHDLSHVRRVWANVRRIVQGEEVHIDWAILRPATVLHDLVNTPKDDPQCHLASQRSAEAALPILHRNNVRREKFYGISHAIMAHSFSSGIEPQTDEARILRDADRLDSLGAIGIARMMYIAGGMSRTLYHPEDPAAKDRQPDDATFAMDHFEMKLLRLEDGMCTRTGRKIAEQRTAYMRGYVRRFFDEASGRDSMAPA